MHVFGLHILCFFSIFANRVVFLWFCGNLIKLEILIWGLILPSVKTTFNQRRIGNIAADFLNANGRNNSWCCHLFENYFRVHSSVPRVNRKPIACILQASARGEEGMTLFFVCCNPSCGYRWRENWTWATSLLMMTPTRIEFNRPFVSLIRSSSTETITSYWLRIVWLLSCFTIPFDIGLQSCGVTSAHLSCAVVNSTNCMRLGIRLFCHQ